jgi:hypothetical protein
MTMQVEQKRKPLLQLSNRIYETLANIKSMASVAIHADLNNLDLRAFRDYWSAGCGLLQQADGLCKEFMQLVIQKEGENALTPNPETCESTGLAYWQMDTMGELTTALAWASAMVKVAMRFDAEEFSPAVIEDYFGALQQILELCLQAHNRLHQAFMLGVRCTTPLTVE